MEPPTTTKMEIDPWEVLMLRLAHEITDSALPPLAHALGAPPTSSGSAEALLGWLVASEQQRQEKHHPAGHFRQRALARLRSAFETPSVGLARLMIELDTFAKNEAAVMKSDASVAPNSFSALKTEAPGVISHGVAVLVPTPKERKLFDFLLEVNRTYNLGCTLRVSGGWVRDKVRPTRSPLCVSRLLRGRS